MGRRRLFRKRRLSAVRSAEEAVREAMRVVLESYVGLPSTKDTATRLEMEAVEQLKHFQDLGLIPGPINVKVTQSDSGQLLVTYVEPKV